MTTRLIPEVGQWYAHRDKGQMFQVVAVDEAQDAVEIQDSDGDVDELDLESWFAMTIELASAPENSTGPADDPDSSEREYTLSADGGERDWRDPLDQLASAVDESEDDEDETKATAVRH
ncbi:MAG: DUF6763 family protein [Pseudomonadota bacterium]|nr:hypothetical protein [Pseudomonadota bacterium]